jgi:hypothetical protein
VSRYVFARARFLVYAELVTRVAEAESWWRNVLLSGQ